MSDSSDSLTEYVDAEIFVDGATGPADEEKLRSVLDHIPGITEVTIAHGRVDVRYDPISIVLKEISQRIEHAGFRIKDVLSAPSSPMTNMKLKT